MTSAHVTQDAVEQLVMRLSDRDRAILIDLARVRVLSGDHLTRLHFSDLAPASRERTRRRVLARLVEHRLAATLERTVGGARAGSSGLVYALGTTGQRALPLLGVPIAAQPQTRARSPWTPGRLFLGHSLAISGLYVALREAERAPENGLMLASFDGEPATWHPDGRGGVMKPDAYAVLQSADVEDCYWAEVDRATESMPTLKRQLLAYVDFARSGQIGPDGIMPRVLLTVPDDHRLAAVRDLVAGLPDPGPRLIFPTRHDQAVHFMITTLRAES